MPEKKIDLKCMKPPQLIKLALLIDEAMRRPAILRADNPNNIFATRRQALERAIPYLVASANKFLHEDMPYTDGLSQRILDYRALLVQASQYLEQLAICVNNEMQRRTHNTRASGTSIAYLALDLAAIADTFPAAYVEYTPTNNSKPTISILVQTNPIILTWDTHDNPQHLAMRNRNIMHVPLGPAEIRLVIGYTPRLGQTGQAVWGTRGNNTIHARMVKPLIEFQGHGGFAHPHLHASGGSFGSICEGDGTIPINIAIHSQRFLDVFTVVNNILNTYNPASPYHPLWNWSYPVCEACRSLIEPQTFKASRQCYCGAVSHQQCAVICSRCETPICTWHRHLVRRCTHCNAFICEECQFTINTHTYCKNCAKECIVCNTVYPIQSPMWYTKEPYVCRHCYHLSDIVDTDMSTVDLGLEFANTEYSYEKGFVSIDFTPSTKMVRKEEKPNVQEVKEQARQAVQVRQVQVQEQEVIPDTGVPGWLQA